MCSGVELEYKFRLKTRAEGERTVTVLRGRGLIGDPVRYDMSSRYYDADGILSAAGFTLRMRRENGVSVCCLKYGVRDADGARLREEYECGADDIAQGIHKLAKTGAPPGFFTLIAPLRLVVCGEVRFTRDAYAVTYCGARLELCLDDGKAFRELELEYKSGDVATFTKFARELQAEFGLIIERESKYSRAILNSHGNADIL